MQAPIATFLGFPFEGTGFVVGINLIPLKRDKFFRIWLEYMINDVYDKRYLMMFRINPFNLIN